MCVCTKAKCKLVRTYSQEIFSVKFTCLNIRKPQQMYFCLSFKNALLEKVPCRKCWAFLLGGSSCFQGPKIHGSFVSNNMRNIEEMWHCTKKSKSQVQRFYEGTPLNTRFCYRNVAISLRNHLIKRVIGALIC